MSTTTVYVPRSPEACWRVFTDPATFPAWVPGLRRARVIAETADGLALEIQFELAASLTYTLRYRYDAAVREVWWEPRAGKRDAVSGSARFEAFDEGTRVIYTLEHGEGRSEAERALGGPEALLEAFVRWMTDPRNRGG